MAVAARDLDPVVSCTCAAGYASREAMPDHAPDCPRTASYTGDHPSLRHIARALDAAGMFHRMMTLASEHARAGRAAESIEAVRVARGYCRAAQESLLAAEVRI